MCPRISEIKPENGSWGSASLRGPRYSHSLERGLAVLGCFTPERPTLGIPDMADILGMSNSTVHRYAITLVALGLLNKDASRKYRLGLRVTNLGMSALNSTGLREHARPYLEECGDVVLTRPAWQLSTGTRFCMPIALAVFVAARTRST